MIILKVTKDQCFTLSLEDAFFKKNAGGLVVGSNRPPQLLRVKDFATIVWYFGNILVVKIKLMYFCKNALNDHFLKPTNS